jgi:hypothetical protein
MMSARLNFQRYDDAEEPYVYVQTSRQIRRLTDPLFEIVRRDPIKKQMEGQLLLDSYYPLPWMLADFAFVSYAKDGQFPDGLNADFIATEKSKADRIEKLLRAPYYRREFKLRDAQEDCVAWFRASIFHDLMPGEKLVGPAESAPK